MALPRNLPKAVHTTPSLSSSPTRLMRLNESRHIEHVRFHMPPPARVANAALGAAVV